MHNKLKIALIALSFFTGKPIFAGENIWILANANSNQSTGLASHYAIARNIPEENVITLPMPQRETIKFREYIDLIYNPLVRALKDAGAINAVFDNEKDALGREQYFFISHRIEYLVTCFGVPLKFSNDPESAKLDGPELVKQFNTLRGAVDSDLSLIPIGNHRLVGPIDNPLFNEKDPSLIRRRGVIRVSRLDGPTYESAKALVDNALEGERGGVWGRALIDIGGPHKQGDDWFRTLKSQILTDTWELSEKPGKQRFQIGDRTEDAAAYFGWYTSKVDGPFAELDYKFAPGAFGFHLHSSSAGSMRKRNHHWTPALIDRGITATVGNVFEPFLHLTHQPQMIYEALREGKTWGEATYYAITGLSWQAIAIGDPMYRPFPNGIGSMRGTQDRDNIYAELLQLRRLAMSQGASAAIAYGLADRDRLSDPSFLIEVARLQADSNRKAALQTLSSGWNFLESEQKKRSLPVALEIAELHAKWGNSSKALEIFDTLIEKNRGQAAENILKERGRKIALSVADFKRTAAWAPTPEKPPENNNP
ncbi:MAG: TIGR03790 family protein [Verrucomicrobiota bacterium]